MRKFNFSEWSIRPRKINLNVDNIPFVESVWRINSKSNTCKFGVRLRGLLNITWHDGYRIDGKGNKCTPESAGFGKVDN
jgi:hypothetical protein